MLILEDTDWVLRWITGGFEFDLWGKLRKVILFHISRMRFSIQVRDKPMKDESFTRLASVEIEFKNCESKEIE